MERPSHRGCESGVKRTVYHESNRAVWSMKKRFAILSMAACVALSGVVAGSGCGVRMGMEKIDDAKQAKQVEKQRHELEKKLQEGQKNDLRGFANHISAASAWTLVSISALALVVLVVRRTGCRMRPSVLARGWGSMEGTAVCAFGPIGARVGGGDRSAWQVAGLSL